MAGWASPGKAGSGEARRGTAKGADVEIMAIIAILCMIPMALWIMDDDPWGQL